MNSFLTIKQDSKIEYTINRSLFIARAFATTNIDQVNERLKVVRKLEVGATHNVYAFNLCNPSASKYSDDGEPHGTSGAPMLNILVRKNVFNVLLVTTRYFGGIKLGTAGLVKAYTTAATMALEAGELATAELTYRLQFTYNYKLDAKIKYLLTKFNISNCDFNFTDLITCELDLHIEEYEEFYKLITNILLENNKIIIKSESYKVF